MAQKYSIQLLAATTAQWSESQYVIPDGELVAELQTDGKIQLKIGNGLHKFSDLPYVADKGPKGDQGDKGDKGDAFKYSDFTATQLAALKGDKGDQGSKGDKGDKGFSPTVNAVKSGTITTVTITDANGTKTFNVNDGLSPTVSTSKTGDTTTVIITDASGSHNFEVKDGAKGDPLKFADLTASQKLELKGETGEGFVVQGTYDTLSLLQSSVTSPEAGVAYGVGSAAPYDIYIYDGVQATWVNHGKLQGAKGDKGDKGEAFTYNDFTSAQLAALKGQDGVSPTVSTSKANGIATVTITDASGTHEFKINDGESLTFDDLTDAQKLELKGDAFTYDDFTSEQLASLKGQDGQSPVVSLSKNDGVATLIIDDINGRKTVNILDGKDANVTVDTEISDTSINPVQNKVIKEYIDGLMGDVETAMNSINSILGGA